MIADEDAPLAVIAQHPRVAAFNRSGAELLLADEREAVIYAFDEPGPRVLARYTLEGSIARR